MTTYTPAEAVELAIEDHKAHARNCVDWPFIEALSDCLRTINRK